MYDCSTIRQLVHATVDRELDVKESLRVHAHVAECESCREVLINEQTFVSLTTTVLEPNPVPEHTRLAVREALSNEVTRVRGTQRRRWALVSPGMGAAVAALAVFFVIPRAHVPELVNVALTEHRIYLTDPDRLQFHAADHREVEHWLRQRTPFPLRIPTHDPAEVRLVGAAVRAGPTVSAILTYTWEGTPVSLLIAPTRTSPFNGGEALAFKNVLFHAARVEGRHVLQWSDHRHTYVLVACRELPPASLPFVVPDTERPSG